MRNETQILDDGSRRDFLKTAGAVSIRPSASANSITFRCRTERRASLSATSAVTAFVPHC